MKTRQPRRPWRLLLILLCLPLLSACQFLQNEFWSY